MWKGFGSKRRCKSIRDEVMYVPVLETLQNMLKNQTVISEVSTIHFIKILSVHVLMLYVGRKWASVFF